jgi:putative transcriptional regulator
MKGLAAVRTRLSLSQKQFGKLIGKGQSAVANYEKGLRHFSIEDAYKVMSFAKKNGVELTLEDFFPPKSS